MRYRLSILILILIGTHDQSLKSLPTVQTVTSDFVKKTNLLVRIRERSKLLTKLADLEKLLLQEAIIDKQKKLRTEYDKLTREREHLDIYLKNLVIDSFKDPIQSTIQMMDLADIHYKDTRLLTHKKNMLEKSKNKAEKEKLKHEIATLEQNRARTDTLLKKTVIKNLDTAQEVPEPTKKSRKKAQTIDAARKKQKETQISSSPFGEKVQLLERTIPLSQQVVSVLEASLFGLDMGIDRAQITSDKLKKSIDKLSALLRSLRALYDKESRLLTSEMSSLSEHKAQHQLFIDSQHKKEIVKKPNPFLGNKQQELEHERTMLSKFLEGEKIVMDALSQAHKKSQSIQQTIEKKDTKVISDELPILYGLIHKLAQRAKLITTTNKGIAKRFAQTFKQAKQDIAKLSQLLAEEEIAP